MNAPSALELTPTRIRLAIEINAGTVRHYGNWRKPDTYRNDGCGPRVTRDVKQLVDLGLAAYGMPGPAGYSAVELTDAGRQWAGLT